METRTLLRDFQSHNQSRSVFTVESGLVCKSRKIRLLDFDVYTSPNFEADTSARLSLHPLAGVYSLIKKISILNLQGQEIDSMLNCINSMTLRLLHMDNGTQLNVGNMVNSTRNGFGNLGDKDIYTVTDTTGINHLYIDLASMLNYLNTREYIAEGFTILVEWNPSSLWAPLYFGADGNIIPLYISSPTLAIDECLGISPMQIDSKPVMFSNLVNDTISLGIKTSLITRLNSYYNQFIGNLYYLNTIQSDYYNGFGFSSDEQETFEITIDGKKLLPLKGINTSARKLAYFNDFTGNSTLVSGSWTKLMAKLNILQEGVKCPDTLYDGNCSFGCIKLDRFIQNDLTLSYSRPDDTNNINVVIMAEVLKMYDPKSGLLSYVRQ